MHRADHEESDRAVPRTKPKTEGKSSNQMKKTNTEDEFQKFDNVMKKILSVSHKELQVRERKYRKNRARKKQAKS